MSFYNSSRSDTKPGGTTGFGESLPTFSDARAKLSCNRPVFSERFKNFSPSAKKSGDEILKDLKEQLRREGDMFFNHSPPEWGFSPKSSLFSKAEDGEDFARRSGMDDIRGRHPMFRMPAWMSEDEDMSDLAARMSHTPHFATMGRRGGPWRERRSSGGSAMSATSDDSCDAPTTDKSSQCSGGSSEVPSHEIPIRLEAPCPPSMAQQSQPQQQQQQQHTQSYQQPSQPDMENEPISPLSSRLNHPRKATQYPVRTTSAVDATQPSEDLPRNTRCSSAPPEMADQPVLQEAQKPPPPQQRFISKINITPQPPQSPGSPKTTATPFSPLPAKFNTVPKPFVPPNKQQSEPQQAPASFEPPQMPEPQPQNNQQYQTQPQYQPPPQQQQQQYPPQQQFHPQPQFPPQQQYQQQQHQQQSPRQGAQRPSIVRNIPIFVEGRDGPVTNEESSTPPKVTPQWGQPWHQQQQQQPQPQQQYQQPPPPPPPPQQQQQQQKPQFRQHTQPQPQVPPQTQPISHPIPAPPPPQQQQQQQQQQQHQQQPPQQAPQPEPQPQPKPQPARDPRLTQIESVRVLVEEYKEKVEAFTGAKNDRNFLYLDEMLTRALLQLDNVDPEGREDVRQARRAVIKSINAAISALEAKASDPKRGSKEKTPENAVVSMETNTQEHLIDTKDSQEVSEKTSDNKEPAVTLPGNETEKNAEVPKEESMETGEHQEGTTPSMSNEKESEVTNST